MVVASLFYSFLVTLPLAQSPTCIPHTAEVCRTQGTIGKDWIFLDTGTTNIEMLAQGMNKVLDHIRVIANGFDAECAEILSEYLCISNYQPCDLSHSDPRPIQVRYYL